MNRKQKCRDALHTMVAGELLNKGICVFLYTKYSRSFVKLRLNPWCHVDYFTNLFVMLLCAARGNNIAVCGEAESFIKNIFISVLKMNEGLTGLERHEGE